MTAEAHAADAAEAHEHDDELAADEPRTPLWLPLLGGVVFLGGLIAFVAAGPEGKTAAELSAESTAAAEAIAAEEAAAAAAAAPPEPAPAPAPAAQPAAPPGRGG
jgi:hypothetical protein